MDRVIHVFCKQCGQYQYKFVSSLLLMWLKKNCLSPPQFFFEAPPLSVLFLSKKRETELYECLVAARLENRTSFFFILKEIKPHM